MPLILAPPLHLTLAELTRSSIGGAVARCTRLGSCSHRLCLESGLESAASPVVAAGMKGARKQEVC